MPHSDSKRSRVSGTASAGKRRNLPEARYTGAVAPALADQVARYARTADTSMSKAIAALVRLGLEGQESRKREFFRKLKANLAHDGPSPQGQPVDAFRALILGR